MAGQEDDALTQEELDALDNETSQGDGEDEDAPGLDAEGEDEGGSEDDSQEDAGQVRPVTRGQRQFGRLRSELQEAKEARARETAELQRQIAELRSAQTAQPQTDPRLEAERLAAMTPEERTEERLRRAEENNQRQIAFMQYQHADQLDRSSFEALAQRDARAAKYKDEVETLLGQARQAGMNLKREVLYYYALGRKVAGAAAAKKPGQRQDANDRTRRQTTRPANAGSDTQAGRRGGKTLEQRLDGVPI